MVFMEESSQQSRLRLSKRIVEVADRLHRLAEEAARLRMSPTVTTLNLMENELHLEVSRIEKEARS